MDLLHPPERHFQLPVDPPLPESGRPRFRRRCESPRMDVAPRNGPEAPSGPRAPTPARGPLPRQERPTRPRAPLCVGTAAPGVERTRAPRARRPHPTGPSPPARTARGRGGPGPSVRGPEQMWLGSTTAATPPSPSPGRRTGPPAAPVTREAYVYSPAQCAAGRVRGWRGGGGGRGRPGLYADAGRAGSGRA